MAATLSQDQFQQTMPTLPAARTAVLYPHLLNTLFEFDIDEPKRVAAFLAQIGHESGDCRLMRELWGPTPAQERYDPPHPKASELGNFNAGDGFKYRGRGAIQLTGKSNYREFGHYVQIDLVAHPELVEEPQLVFRAAGWFWKRHRLNQLADKGDFDAITKIINGGRMGKIDRDMRWARAKRILGVADATGVA